MQNLQLQYSDIDLLQYALDKTYTSEHKDVFEATSEFSVKVNIAMLELSFFVLFENALKLPKRNKRLN